jgi:ribosomal protein L16 Arg81 hydroxylase
VDEEIDSDGERSFDAPEPMKYMVDEYEEARTGPRPPWECIMEPGELIFVPTGWWHMVAPASCPCASILMPPRRS